MGLLKAKAWYCLYLLVGVARKIIWWVHPYPTKYSWPMTRLSTKLLFAAKIDDSRDDNGND